jgi:hypothetical protein
MFAARGRATLWGQRPPYHGGYYFLKVSDEGKYFTVSESCDLLSYFSWCVGWLISEQGLLLCLQTTEATKTEVHDEILDNSFRILFPFRVLPKIQSSHFTSSRSVRRWPFLLRNQALKAKCFGNNWNKVLQKKMRMDGIAGVWLRAHDSWCHWGSEIKEIVMGEACKTGGTD